MPYIKEKDRDLFDRIINDTIIGLKCSFQNQPCVEQNLTDEQFLLLLGKINYIFSTILGGVCGRVTYSKIAMVTGVLENIKQEYYRRIASPYEDEKIVQNGDIRHYKKA